MPPPLLACLAGAALVLGALLWRRARATAARRPPGPPAYPLVGNILDVEPQAGWHKLTRYRDVYGDLLYFHGLGNKILVLNSTKAIADLLDKRAGVYSDRPAFTVVGELMGLGRAMPLLSNNAAFREQRRLVHTALSPTAVRRYHGVQEDLAALLCVQLLDDPDNFFDYVRLTAGRLILSITYGLSVDKAEDEYISHAEATMQMISRATTPGAFLADLIPAMKHLPRWLPFHREARAGREMLERLVRKPFHYVREEMKEGRAPPSLTQDLLASLEADASAVADPARRAMLEDTIMWSTGSLYGAGGETTYSTVLTCLMAMALHPHALARAHAELDAVVGPERVPDIRDRPDLPYIHAVIQETMRWKPALPLGIAHCTAQEDVYEGYVIPQGTIVMPNVWAIAFDPKQKDPEKFVPERYLEGKEGEYGEVVDVNVWAFGFGRRVCPGRHLAENSLFILIATILATFDITPVPGEELVPNYGGGLVSYPKPFKVRLVRRSEAKAALVRERAAQSTV